jgi:hypothetical protein
MTAAVLRLRLLLALLLVAACSADDVDASDEPSATAWALAAGQPEDVGPDVTPDNATVHAMASARPEFVHVRNGELPLLPLLATLYCPFL